MNIQLDDIMKVEDELGVELTESQRTEVLNEYYETIGDEQNKYEPWFSVVENIIYQIQNNN
jgi:hypothetical protein